jgi:hypothetical protein
MLRQIAYPRRGTEEEEWDIHNAAVMIQMKFSLNQLEA